MRTITKRIREERRTEADKRNSAYAELSLDQKIAKLDKAFGGPLNGAQRQYRKLLIQKAKTGG